MKHYMELIVYNGKDKPVFRKNWQLPNVTIKEFDPITHHGKVFMYPEIDVTKGQKMDIEGMYVWQSCIPEDNDEEAKLIKMGKWTTLKAGTYGAKVSKTKGKKNIK